VWAFGRLGVWRLAFGGSARPRRKLERGARDRLEWRHQPHSVPTQPVHVASALAAAGGGYATILPVPGIVGLPATREALEKDPAIADVLRLADQVPLAIFAAGALSKDSVLVEAGNLPEEKVDELIRLGSVGDVLGRFIDQQGNIVDPSIDSRTVGLHPARLREKTHSICVAGGKAKHLAVLGALRARYCNIVITDQETGKNPG
jgi:deoxyribonucleoside regulator